MMRVVLVSALWLCGMCEYLPTKVTSMLDPNRLTWWRSKWSPAPIILSTNNRGMTASATLYFTPTTSLAKGVLEVTFPSGFTVSGSSGLVVTLTDQTYAAGADYAVTVQNVKNPDVVGGYGPFCLRTRATATGPQVDVNLTFGTVYIVAEPKSLGQLTVSLVAAAGGNVINRSGNSLSFKFTISVSLWKYDTFGIGVDRRWTVDSKLAKCRSEDYSGKVNNFNGTKTADPHSLQCVATQKSAGQSQTLYVYGLAVDAIDISSSSDNQYVDLRVDSVTTPDAVYPVNTYLWSVTTYRFGTFTMLETATYSSGPSVSPDTFRSATWTPTWGPASEVVAGEQVFMEIGITVMSAIPAGGSLDIKLTEDATAADSFWLMGKNCYVVTYLSKDVACAFQFGSITLTSLPDVASSREIRIRNVVKFTSVGGAKVGIAYAYSYQTTVAAGVVLDYGQNLALFTIPTDASLLKAAGSLFHDSTTTSISPKNAAGGLGTYKLGVQFFAVGAPQTDISSASAITISCPFATGMSEFHIGVPSALYYYKDNITAGATNMQVPGGYVGLTSPVLTASSDATKLGTLTFSGSIGTVAMGLKLLMYQPSTSTGPFITLPMVVNNLATTYECRYAVVTPSKLTQRGAWRFAVSGQTYITGKFSAGCRSITNGVPAWVIISPNVVPIYDSTDSRTYYVEAGFPTADMKSGLGTGTVTSPEYLDALSFSVPHAHMTSAGTTTTARLMTINGSTRIAVSGLPYLAPGAPDTTIYFPIGGLATVSVAPQLITFFINRDDPRVRFETHSASTPSLTYQAMTSTGFTTSGVIGGSNQQINGEPHTSGWVINLTTLSTLATAHYFFFILPPGFTWSATRSVRNIVSAVDYTDVWYFSSPSPAFAYPGVLIGSQVAAATVALGTTTKPTTGTIQIKGFIPALGAGTQTVSAACSNTVLTSPSCTSYSTLSFTSTTGAITSLVVSPATVVARGPESLSVVHAVMFTLQHGVPAGGTVTLGIAADWASTAFSTCTMAVSGTTCTISSNVAVIAFASNYLSTQTFSVEITELLPPLNSSVGTSSTLFVSKLSSSTGTADIDVCGSFSASGVKVTPALANGEPLWLSITTAPRNAKLKSVDLYLKFFLPHTVRKGGTITIKSPLAFTLSGSIRNYCFLSPVIYQDCYIDSAQLIITLDQNLPKESIVEVLLDSAVDNPSTSASTTNPFAVSTSWAGYQIDWEKIPVMTFAADPPLTTEIANPVVTVQPKNAGEVATYVFSFTDSAALGTGESYWVQFPAQYDYFVGDAEMKYTSDADSYYLECSSPQLPTLFCTVNHGTVMATSGSVLVAGSHVELAIAGVMNPKQGTTGLFQVLHVGTNGRLLSANQSFGTVAISAMAQNLSIRSLTSTTRALRDKADYTFRLYITDQFSTDTSLKVLFPREFDLVKFQTEPYVSCSSTYYEAAITATAAFPLTWNAANSCGIEGNWATMPPSQTLTAFTQSNEVILTLRDVKNPQWGNARSAVTFGIDFDATDTVLWPSTPYWTSHFSVFIYQNATDKQLYSSRSYDGLNAAYLGLETSCKPLLANHYIPASKASRITVYPGTQTTDLSLSTETPSKSLTAQQVTFTPLTNSKTADVGGLKYTSRDQWRMVTGQSSISFRVAAAISLPRGLYYVDWSVSESKQVGVNSPQYCAPPSTLIEVYAKKQGVSTLTISTIPPVIAGAMSVPITISTDNAPHTEVIVTIADGNTSELTTISPSVLTFGPDVNELYFSVEVVGNYEPTSMGSRRTLVFSLSGKDAEAFTISEMKTFTITVPDPGAAPGAISSLNLGKPTKTSITANPTIDSSGIFYYHLAALGTPVPSLREIKELIANTTTTASSSETSPKLGESWKDFQHRLYRAHLTKTWFGSVPMYSSYLQKALVFDWLYADTKYRLVGYADSLNTASKSPTPFVTKFETEAMDSPQPFSLVLEGIVDPSLQKQIGQTTAIILKFNPQRLVDEKYSTSSHKRQLETTQYTILEYLLLADRRSATVTPSEELTVSDTEFASLQQALISMGINYTLSELSLDAIPARSYPTWKRSPTSSGVTDTSISISLLADINGQTCCIALTEKTTELRPEQILYSVDSNNNPTNATCITTDLNLSPNLVTISGLSPGTLYYVYCTASDDYPLWPTTMAYSTEKVMTPVPVTTSGSSEKDGNGDGALWGVNVAALILIAQ